MIDIRDLRANPDRYRWACRAKRIDADVDLALELDARRREVQTRQQELKNQQRTLEKEIGPRIGRLMASLKDAAPEQRDAIRRQADELKAEPARLKERIAALERELADLEPRLNEVLLTIPLPPDPHVPAGESSADNVEIRRWNPPGFDPDRPFHEQRGFHPKTHLQLVADLGLCDFERGVKLAGTRSYVLTGDGFRLHNAVLNYALDVMIRRHGFTPVSVPVLVREQAMVGTAFFPSGRDQAYLVAESARGGGHDLYLTGTGEVGLMGLHAEEILDEAALPLTYVTCSTCFRREAGAAGRDTAGLYRIHQFDKVEQVVICRADADESKAWHARMIGFVEELLRSLGLPYRLVQCCTADLGPKNADMVDIECWMPGRGEPDAQGIPRGAYGETHSASRLDDYQCRRLNIRSRPGGQRGQGPTTFCHSLNNTVVASPRILIPILEMHQNADGSVTIPEPLRPYLDGRERIEPR